MTDTATVVPTPGVAATRRRSRGSGTLIGWLATRITIGVATLLLVSVLVFLATQALPGDVARIILGNEATPDQVLLLRTQLGLDEPLITQYLTWLGGFVTGNWGNSLLTGFPVTELVGPRLLNSATLLVISMVISIPSAILLGVYTAERRDGVVDRLLLRFAMVVNAIPDFVLGTLLVVLLGTTVFTIFPPVAIIPPGDMPWWYPAELFLPVLTIVLMAVTYLYRLVRASVIDVLESEYVQMAELKGMRRSVILFRHALPNAIVPTIQASSLIIAACLGGLVVIEYVFAYPGIGTLLTDSVGTRDLPVLQAIILIIAATYFVCNLVADLLSGVTNRRAR
ncbi:ABC transporter permease [Microbacterium saperdae]